MEKLSLATKLAYGFVQLGINLIGVFLALHLVFFYVDTLGVAPSAVSLALFVAAGLQVLVVPLAGHWSDRTDTRFGRRRPYVLAGAPPLGLCFALLLAPPEAALGDGFAALCWLGVVLAALYTVRTFVEVPYTALLPELTRDYDERTGVASVRQLFGTLGDLIGAMVPALLIATAALGARAGFASFGGLAALAIATSGAVTFFGTRERGAGEKAAADSLRESGRFVARSRALRVFCATYALALIGSGTATALFPFVIKYVLEATALQPHYFGAYFVGALPALPLWAALARRIGKKAAFQTVLVGNALVLATIFFFGPGNAWAFFPVMILGGGFAVALWSLGFALVADIVEWEEARTGQRRAGAISGVYVLGMKASAAVALALVSGGLSISGFEPAASAPAETAVRLRILFGLVSPALLVAAAAAFSRFPITRETYTESLRALRAR